MVSFAYFGTPVVASDTLARLVAAGHVPRVVVSSPAAPKGRGLSLIPSDAAVWASEHGIPVLTPPELTQEVLQQIMAYECTIGIVVAYGKIIPQSYLDAFPAGVLNIHYSLLPAYRGASPVESALRNGDTMTGVTIQRMVYALDAGDILAQREVEILPTDTTRTLRPRLIAEGADLLIETLPSIVAGSCTRVPQDPTNVTRAPKIAKVEGHLDLAGDPLRNWHTYRALIESPGTYFFAERDGTRVRVKIIDAAYEQDRFVVKRIVPEGKAEQPFTYLADNGWKPVP